MSTCEPSIAVGEIEPGLSTGGLAGSITYATGDFVRGKWTGFDCPFKASMAGADYTISLAAGVIRRSQSFGNPELIRFSFSRGTVTVKDRAGRTVFRQQLRDGLIAREFASVDVEIRAALVPDIMVRSGFASFRLSFMPFGENVPDMEFGSAVVSIVPNPESARARAAWSWAGGSRWFTILRARFRRLLTFESQRRNYPERARAAAANANAKNANVNNDKDEPYRPTAPGPR